MRILVLRSDLIVSKRIFTSSIMFMILAVSLCSYAELPVDSLKKICIKDYNKKFMRYGRGMQNSADSIYVVAEEIYKDIFTGVKIFTVAQGNCDDCPGSNYILDTDTGEQPRLKNVELFNKEMSRNRKQITNYDKACFYLDFNNLSQNTTPSSLYYKYMVNGSVYKGLPQPGLVGYGNLSLNWSKYSDYINRSSKREIYIGAVTYDQAKGKKVMMYHFSFDRNGQLKSIVNVDLD